eukprot:GHVT01090735.1.p1 GENE.GHVT01090735.1~~GHVT01090735.1.p1  ORF type:complete len:180 (+),score=23.40 GHVT01090735.1:419-958(+)
MAEGKGNHAIVRMHPNAAIHGLAARLCAAWPWHSGSSVSQQFLHQCAFCSRFLQRPSLVAAVEGTSPSPSRLEALLAPRRLTAPGERAAVAAGSRRRLRRAFVSEFDDRLEEVSDDSVVCNLEDWSLGIFVEGYDHLRPLNAGNVLNGSRNPDGNVEIWGNYLARLTDLHSRSAFSTPR